MTSSVTGRKRRNEQSLHLILGFSQIPRTHSFAHAGEYPTFPVLRLSNLTGYTSVLPRNNDRNNAILISAGDSWLVAPTSRWGSAHSCIVGSSLSLNHSIRLQSAQGSSQLGADHRRKNAGQPDPAIWSNAEAMTNMGARAPQALALNSSSLSGCDSYSYSASIARRIRIFSKSIITSLPFRSFSVNFGSHLDMINRMFTSGWRTWPKPNDTGRTAGRKPDQTAKISVQSY